jgi:hypothetical protein
MWPNFMLKKTCLWLSAGGPKTPALKYAIPVGTSIGMRRETMPDSQI